MKLQIKVDENGKITDAKFKTFGCGSAIASSSLATEWVKGKSVSRRLKIFPVSRRSDGQHQVDFDGEILNTLSRFI